MKRGFVIFLAICALTAAFVPRDRRAVETEEGKSNVKQDTKICAVDTPCAWSLFKPPANFIMENVTNTYCVCASDAECIFADTDKSSNAFVYRCRPRSAGSQS